MPATFAIVDFVHTKEVEVVPVTWISGDKCVWPPFRTNEVKKMVKKLVLPSEEWVWHEARVLGEYSTYDLARKYLLKAEEDTDLASEKELGKGCRKKYHTRHSTSSDDEVENSLSFTETTGIRIPKLKDASPNVLHEASEPPQGSSSTQGSSTQQGTSAIGNSEAIMSALQNLTKEILKIKENQKLILANQEMILNQQCASVQEKAVAENVIPVYLPVKTLEDLVHLENALLDSSTMDFLVNLVSNGGGGTVDATVKRIVKKLLTDAVAQQYSWLGAKGKLKFCDLQLAKVVFVATRNNLAIQPFATDSAIEMAIKNWLRHAKARNVKTVVQIVENDSTSLI